MIPRLRSRLDGGTMDPSMLREKVDNEYFRFIAVEFEKLLLHP